MTSCCPTPPGTSGRSAAGSSRRRWSPRSTSWTRPTAAAKADPAFVAEFEACCGDYAGAPSLLYEARRLSAHAGARILLKREDLLHTGAHKVRNVLGQALLTKRMGKRRVIAETGAGQHGVAAATAAAYSTSSASSTWASSTPSARRSTWPGCGCWAPRSSR